jgi:hypothetical protein
MLALSLIWEVLYTSANVERRRSFQVEVFWVVTPMFRRTFLSPSSPS